MPFSVYYLCMQLVLLSNQKKETFLLWTISWNKYVIVICSPAWFPVTFPFSCNVFHFVSFLSISRPFSCKINYIIVIQWPIAPGKIVTEDRNSRMTFIALTTCAVLSRSVMFDSLWPHGLWPIRLLCPWGFSEQEYWNGCPPPGDFPNPGIKPRSPTMQADSLPSEPPGKPQNIGVSSLSLLQGNFLTQESKWGPLHCRWILYQLNYPGSQQT